MNDQRREIGWFSAPEVIVDAARRWLVEHPDAPLIERVSCATVVVCGGRLDGDATMVEIARCAGPGVEPGEAMQALLAAREQHDATAASSKEERTP